MAIVLPNSIFLHIPKTGGEWVREVLWRSGLEAVKLDPGAQKHADLDYFAAHGNFGRSFRFAFVRHPVMWYRSYFTYQSTRGWREIPKVPLSRYRAERFEDFVENVTQAEPGFLGRLYQRYVAGIEFVGRTENLRSDLGVALRLAGEQCPEELIATLPARNARSQAGVAPEVCQRIIETERECCKQFGYQETRHESVS